MPRATELSNPRTVPTPHHLRGGVIAIAVVLALSLLLAQHGQAQTLTVLHTFTGSQDGGYPEAGLTMDRAGNLYGTTYDGGYPYAGNVFKVTRGESSWVLTPLYTFDFTHGSYPQARVVFGPDGALYGTTAAGGQSGCYYEGAGCGVVFKLQPPPTECHSALCPWTQTVIHYFQDDPDGATPGFGDLIFDQQGRIYGTTWRGGSGYERGGTLFQISPANGYRTTILHNFGDESGSWPLGGTSFDASGNLYGTTWFGGADEDGVVYQMMPSGSGWQYNVIHSFDSTDGNSAKAALFQDAAGNFFSTTEGGGTDGVGVVFEMTSSGGGWTYNVLYNFLGKTQFYDGPLSPLISDAQGNLYGDTLDGGLYGGGSVFKLTPTESGWVYTSLHDFTCGADGCGIFGPLVMDAQGNIYGTANGGGVANCGNGYGCGTVWEITP